MLNRMVDVPVLMKQHAQIIDRFTTLEAMAPDMPLALLVAPTKHQYLSLWDADCQPIGDTERLHGVQQLLQSLAPLFQELQQMHWHDFWWRRVSIFWSALVEADTGSLHSIIFHDAIQLALAGCKFSWAAQVFQCFSALGEPLPLVADAPIAIDIKLLQELSLRDKLASFDSLP